MGIIDFFKSLFGLSTSNNADDNKSPVRGQFDDSAPLPGTELFFDDKLITGLKQDHQTLVGIYTKMSKALDENDAESVVSLFTEFSGEFRRHILTENVKLYVYLTHAMVSDEESLAMINELRTEMQGIGRAVNQFFSKYSDLPWDEEKIASFPEEFKGVGGVLVDRIKREEETLYPLYMPPTAYTDLANK